MCAHEFKAEDSKPERKVLYRCITCSDLRASAKSTDHNAVIHICTTCHTLSSLYHASSHCWTKVFIAPQADAYRYDRGKEWCKKLNSRVNELAYSSETGTNDGMLTSKGS